QPAPQPAHSPPQPPTHPPTQPTTQPTTQPPQGSQPQPAQPPAAAASTPAAPAGLVAAEDLPAGNFWQVMAIALPQAEHMRTTLKDHGFAVILSPGTKGLIRVLVGPYTDQQSFGKAKTELENVGMAPQRYRP